MMMMLTIVMVMMIMTTMALKTVMMMMITMLTLCSLGPAGNPASLQDGLPPGFISCAAAVAEPAANRSRVLAPRRHPENLQRLPPQRKQTQLHLWPK